MARNEVKVQFGGSPRGKNWAARRLLALQRDSYTCQDCGISMQRGLHVHHLKPVRMFRTPEAANDLNNLVTLCPQCHAKAEVIAKQKFPKRHRDYVKIVPISVARGSEWKKARHACLVRDNYQCQSCGVLRYTGMHVHHIRPEKYYKVQNNAHKLSNLVTLCDVCHTQAEYTVKVFRPPYKGWQPPHIRQAIVALMQYNLHYLIDFIVSPAIAEWRNLQKKKLWSWKPGQLFVVLPPPKKILLPQHVGKMWQYPVAAAENEVVWIYGCSSTKYKPGTEKSHEAIKENILAMLIASKSEQWAPIYNKHKALFDDIRKKDLEWRAARKARK